MDVSKLCQLKKKTYTFLGQTTLSPITHKKHKHCSTSACTGHISLHLFWPQVSKEVNIATPRLIQWDWSTSLMILIGITKLVEWPGDKLKQEFRNITKIIKWNIAMCKPMTLKQELGLLCFCKWVFKLISNFIGLRIHHCSCCLRIFCFLSSWSSGPVVDSTPFLVDTFRRSEVYILHLGEDSKFNSVITSMNYVTKKTWQLPLPEWWSVESLKDFSCKFLFILKACQQIAHIYMYYICV